jgi:DNA-binding transcriptional LysR family regulator
MNTRDVEAFLAVVETGSIVGASARLHLTQPGVTRRIQSLEEQLGVPLLERQSKPLKPTAAGRETYAHGRRLLAILDDLKAELSPDGAISGEFRFGISPYLSEVGITVVADTLRTNFPDLTLRICTGWPEQLLEQLRRNEIDAAGFCLPEGMSPPTELDAEALDIEPVCVVVPGSLDVPSPATLHDLSPLPWIFNQDGCGFRSVIRRRFEQDHLPLRIGVEALSSDLRLSLVARGLGITLATQAAVQSSAVRDALQIISVHDFEPKVRAWIVRQPTPGRLSRPVECLTGALKAAIEVNLHGRG